MNPSSGIGSSPFHAGRPVSAGKLNALHTATFKARGENGVNVRFERGEMVIRGSGVVDNSHPFKLSAQYDNDDAPSLCLVSIAYGTLQGEYAAGTTYTGVPLFEGSGGTALDASTPPTFDIGVTARTSYFYFVVTTDEYGRVDNCWIERFLAADLPLTDTPYVQPGFPLASDTGSAGTYYWLLGTVQVATTGTPPDEVYLAPIINQSTQTSQGFYTAGAAGRFYRT